MSHQRTSLVMIPVVSCCFLWCILINNCHLPHCCHISGTAALLMLADTHLVGQCGSCWWDGQWIAPSCLFLWDEQWIAFLMSVPVGWAVDCPLMSVPVG